MTMTSVGSGQKVSGVTLALYDTLTVTSGGIATGTTVSNGGALVNYGGVTSGTIVRGGSETVSSGYGSVNHGLASGTVVSAGSQILDSGGDSIGTRVSAGARQVINVTASANTTTVNGGTVDIEGGTAVGTVIGSGGSLSFGYLRGGYTTGTVVGSGGYEQVAFGGTAIGTIVQAGGQEFVTEQGVTVGTRLNSGSYAKVAQYAHVSATVVSSGATLYVLQGAVVSNTVVQAGGTLVVIPGGQAVGTVNSGGNVAPGAILLDAAGLLVSGGATLSRTTVLSGYAEFVVSGGIATSSTVFAGGQVVVSDGGLIKGTILSGYYGTNATIVLISSGGIASGTVATFGTQIVSSGGIAYATQIASYNGSQLVLRGGVASGTRLANGTETVSSGGTAVGTLVSKGGHLTVNRGGLSLGATVSSGGILLASGTVEGPGGVLLAYGGVASGTFVSSGGTVILGSGVGRDIHVGSGGILYDFSAGFTTGTRLDVGAYLYLNLAYTSSGFASYDANTDVLTITEGNAVVTEQLAGDYSGKTFSIIAGQEGYNTELLVTDLPSPVQVGPGTQRVVVDPANAYVGGGGADEFVVDAATIRATIDGRSRDSSLTLMGGGPVTMGPQITGIGAVRLIDPSGGTAYTFTANAIPGLTIFGSTGADTITAGPGGDVIVLQARGATVQGGTGDDTIKVTQESINSTITGGGGHDSLTYDGGGTGVMGSGITGIAEVHIGDAPGRTTFVANGNAGLVVVGSHGDDVILLGDASQTAYTFGQNATVIVSAADAGARIGVIEGHATLQVTGGGHATLSDADTHGLVVQAMAPTVLDLGRSGFITGIGLTANTTITASQANDTLESTAGGDELVGYAGHGTQFVGTAAGLLNDTLLNFGGDDTIDATDLDAATATVGLAANGILTLADATHSTQLSLAGGLNPANFHLAADGHGGTVISYGGFFKTGGAGPARITGNAGQTDLSVSGGGPVMFDSGLTDARVIKLADGGAPTQLTATGAASVTILTSLGADTVRTGAAGDTVYVRGAGSTIASGGKDTIHVDSATIASTIDGAGKAFLFVDGGGAAVMGNAVTNIAEVHLAGAAGGPGTQFTANATRGLVVVGSGANDTITAGAASQTVYTFGAQSVVNATAATAGARVQAVSGAVALHIGGGGTATLNDADSHGLVATIAAGMTLHLGHAAFITGEAEGAGATLIAEQVRQTLVSVAGRDTLVGFAGGHTIDFRGTVAGLAGDTIQNFGKTDTIEVTNLLPSQGVSYVQTSLAQGTLSFGGASLALTGRFTPALFHVAGNGGGGSLISYG